MRKLLCLMGWHDFHKVLYVVAITKTELCGMVLTHNYEPQEDIYTCRCGKEKK